MNNQPIQVNFPKEILEYELSDGQIKDVNNQVLIKLDDNTRLKKSCKDCGGINFIFLNIYKMLFIFNYTTGEIKQCFLNRGLRTIEKWLKYLNWELDKFEAQQRVVNREKRDYKNIRNKSRQTMIETANISSPEEYTRQCLNTSLPIILKNKEVIVGLNNISILENGKEIDIPIIIIDGDIIHKYAVEYNEEHWHKDKRVNDDKIKKGMIEDKNYKLFYIIPKSNATSNQIKEYVNEEVKKIANQILCEVN